MSPTRRSLLQAIVGAAATSALPATIPTTVAHEPTKHEALIAIRDELARLRDRAGVSAFAAGTAECAIGVLDMAIMTLCPHGRDRWIAGGRDSYQPNYRRYDCPQCGTWGSYPAE